MVVMVQMVVMDHNNRLFLFHIFLNSIHDILQELKTTEGVYQAVTDPILFNCVH